MSRLTEALEALRRGEAVLLYDADGREEETDLVIASEFATPEAILNLRTAGGGLVCTAVAPEHHQALGLPYLADMVAKMSAEHPILGRLLADDIKYDPSKSTFSLTINHRETYTGIPDEDRSKTVTALAEILRGVDGVSPETAMEQFGSTFRSPGHCILLNGAPGGLAQRQGHTELSLELARQAGVVPCTTICEMLGTNGKALPRAGAEAYAKEHGLVFLTGQEVVDAWQAGLLQSEEAPAVVAS